MKISVITPTYNCKEKIEASVKSAFEQAGDISFEYIIMDGGSTDGTTQEIELLKNKYDKEGNVLKLYAEKDDGIYDAMNRGVKHADGDYIIFLGAGDYLLSEAFLSVENAYTKNDSDIIYGYVMTRRGDKEEALVRYADKKYTYRILPVCHQSIFAKRELFDEKQFEVKYKAVADQDWIMYMLKHGKRFEYIQRAVSFYEEDGFSSNPETVKQCRRDLNEIHSKYYPMRKLFYRMTHFWKKQGF